MAAIDIILLLIFIVSAWLGFRKGIITQLGSVAAIVIAIIACRMFGGTVEQIFFDNHPDWQAGSSISHYAVSILANGVIYLVAYYAVILVTKLLHTVSHIVLLAPLDHIAGAAFSVAKYGLVVSLLLNLYIVCFPNTHLIADSRLAGGKAVEWTIGFAPWVLDTIHPVEKDTENASGNEEATPVETDESKTVSRSIHE